MQNISCSTNSDQTFSRQFIKDEWIDLTTEEKRSLLKKELLEEMVTVAREQGLQLAVRQIIDAIERTEYSADEIEFQHAAYVAWRTSRNNLQMIW